MVVVFHATQDEAQTLAEVMPWIDVLIVANDEQPATLSCERLPCSKETAIVTNATQGAAVGMLTVKINKERQAQAGVNRYHNVSEKITPNANISHLLGGLCDVDNIGNPLIPLDIKSLTMQYILPISTNTAAKNVLVL